VRLVGARVGEPEIVGEKEVEAVIDGDEVVLGREVGSPEGSSEIEGSSLGCDDTDGTSEGDSEGDSDGMDDTLGSNDGIAETEGCMDGVWEGASLCGRAPSITKSDAVAAVDFAIAFTFVSSTELATPLLSKFITAMPLTSYFPGATSESTILWSAT